MQKLSGIEEVFEDEEDYFLSNHDLLNLFSSSADQKEPEPIQTSISIINESDIVQLLESNSQKILKQVYTDVILDLFPQELL